MIFGLKDADDSVAITAKSMNVREKNLQQGAATHIVAGFDQEIVGDNGGYLEDCNIFVPMADWARGTENADRLWELSEQLVGQKFALCNVTVFIQWSGIMLAVVHKALIVC